MKLNTLSLLFLFTMIVSVNRAQLFTNFTRPHSATLIGNEVYEIAIDAQGNKWFGTTNGVSTFDGTNWTNYNTVNGLFNNRVNDIVIDDKGNKWFGTKDGVSKFDGTKWTNYKIKDGLAYNEVEAIIVDKKGNT